MHATDRLTKRRSVMLTQQQQQQHYWSIAAMRQELRQKKHKQHTFEIKTASGI